MDKAWYKKRKEIMLYGVMGILFVSYLLLIFCANMQHFNYKMNSDIGAEAVLGRLIWESGEIIPTSWISSTETRIIATPQIAALFYGLTGDMNLSLGLACCVMSGGIMVAIFIFMKKAGCRNSSCAVMCLLSLSLAGNMTILELLYLFASYYGIHVIAFFIVLSCYNILLRQGDAENTERWKIVTKCIVSVLFAFLLGMQGTRGILITFGPLFGIEVIRLLYELFVRKSKKEPKIIPFIWSSVLLVVSYIGTKMPFATGQEISRNIRNGFPKLFKIVLPDTGKAIGFREGYFLQNICLGILVLYVLWQVLRLAIRIVRRQTVNSVEWCFLVVAASPVVTAVMVAFTTVESSERYYFMWIFAMTFAVTLLWEQQRTKIISGVGFIVAVVIIVINLDTIYIPIVRAQEPTPSDALEVVRYLEENGYKEAYSTFESANMMTALSNGKVNVYALNSFASMDMCQWLTSTDWYPVDGVADQSGTVYVVPDIRLAELEQFAGVGGVALRF